MPLDPPLGEYRQTWCCLQTWSTMPRADKCQLKKGWKALPWMNRGPGSLIWERQLRECSSFSSSRQMPREKKMWLLTLNLSAEANAREGEELFKVKDNVGLRTNVCNLAMNKFRLKIRKGFLTITGVSSQLFNRNSRNPIPIQSNLIRLLKTACDRREPVYGLEGLLHLWALTDTGWLNWSYIKDFQKSGLKLSRDCYKFFDYLDCNVSSVFLCLFYAPVKHGG